MKSDKLLIPLYAKRIAKKELSTRRNKSKNNSNMSISGLKQAEYLITHKYLSKRRAIIYYKFYQKRKNCRTKICERGMNLWGGRKFLKTKIFRFIKRKK